MRILHISAFARAFTQFRFELLVGLRALGVDAHLLATHEEVHVAKLRDAGFGFTSVDVPSRPAIRHFRALATIRSASTSYELVALHQPMALLLGATALAFSGKRIIYFTGGLKANDSMGALTHAAMSRIELWLLRRVDLVLSVNREDDDLLRRSGICSVYVGPRGGCGIDTERFRGSPSARSAIRSELGIPADAIVAGMVGRIEEEKGLFEVVEAFRKIDLEENCWLVLVGSGAGDDKLRTRLSCLPEGEAARIRFVGRREDVERYYAALDVFILASKREGMPTSLLEAMASSCVVLSTRVRGAREVVKSSENGWLVADVEELCAALPCVLRTPPHLRAEIAREARRTVELEYSLKALLPRTLGVMMEHLEHEVDGPTQVD